MLVLIILTPNKYPLGKKYVSYFFGLCEPFWWWYETQIKQIYKTFWKSEINVIYV